MSYQIETHVAKRLQDFFIQFDFIDKVEVFGSRARHDASPKSDIDLCIYSLEMSDKEFTKLKIALDELPILYKVDIVHFESSNDALKKNILRDGKLFFIKILPFDKFFKNTTPKPYQIEKKDYLESGKYPVVDQGKKFIVGYSNQEEKLFKLENPIIIFGDHTRIIKYIDFDFIIGADGTKILFPYDDKINPKYAYYQLLHTKIENLGYSRHYKILKEKTFQKPSLTKQKQIAKTLDKAQELIELRKESIDKLDALAKSIFIDMFGDPVSNPMNWDTKTIEEIVQKEKYSIKRGPFGGSLKKDSFVNDGYLVYEQYHALNNDFSMQRYFIDEKKFNELKAFEVKAGDIIISCSGVYLGKLAIVPENNKKGIINQALLKISLDENKMKKLLFLYIFRNNNFKSKFFGSNIGSGVPNFPSMPKFKKFSFIVPPMEIQKVFISKVEKVEQQKSLYQEELTKLQENFDALLAESFKG